MRNGLSPGIVEFRKVSLTPLLLSLHEITRRYNTSLGGARRGARRRDKYPTQIFMVLQLKTRFVGL